MYNVTPESFIVQESSPAALALSSVWVDISNSTTWVDLQKLNVMKKNLQAAIGFQIPETKLFNTTNKLLAYVDSLIKKEKSDLRSSPTFELSSKDSAFIAMFIIIIIAQIMSCIIIMFCFNKSINN